MKIYLGYTGNKIVAGFMRKYDCGWLFNPTNYCLNFKENFCVDNNCFGPWWRNKAWEEQGLKWENLWDECEFYDFVRKIISLKPDFTVIPDMPAKGMRSFEYSLKHLGRIPHPRYLAVQDGMFSNCIHLWLLDNPGIIDGIFVGGTSRWKIENIKMYSDLAHLHKLKCHVGRIGTFQGYKLCELWGVDSVDGTNPSRNCDERPLKMFQEQKGLHDFDLLDFSDLEDYRYQNLADGVDGI